MVQHEGRRRPDWPLIAAALVAALAIAAAAAVLRPPGDPAPAAGPHGTGPDTVDMWCAGHPVRAARELRGMWITTINNLDWPSRPGLDAEKVKAEFRGWLDVAEKRRHNAVFVHVRPSGDAFWPSEYAPWSRWLTGRDDGGSPGWDPMQFMVAETHARNMEFHAWFNPYKASHRTPRGTGAKALAVLPAGHPLRAHPDWAVTYPVDTAGSRLYYDPGNPQARRFVEDSILEAVNRYDIDGVHFDDFFYPYPAAGQEFDDDASFARHGKGFGNRDDWRRDNVNQFVRGMNQRIKAAKPWVKFGISPFGIWRNRSTDSGGSATRGLQSYDSIYADTRLWVRKQWLDYIVPQLYWHIGFDIADYATLLSWWSRTVAGTRVHLYIGQADYRVGNKGAWRDPAELERQLALNRRHGVKGSVHFSARHVRDDPLGAVSRYAAAHYAAPALPPAMKHLPSVVPAAPQVTGARRVAGPAVTVHWRAGQGATATGYAVYRVEGDARDATLVATVRRGGAVSQTWTDRTAKPGRAYAYCVAALDRLGTQSAVGAPARVS